MKLSYNWLNDYFGGKLPKVEQAAKLLDDHAMEIESVEKVGGDTVIDAKTTPNLNHTCLAHRGVARELGAIIGAKPSLYSRKFKDFNLPKATGKISVSIDEPAKCRRYIGRLVENVKIGPSPKWLVEKLETLGQRSINNVVDATNFVMLEIGQPMHAFAADKIPSGKILVRNAKAGEHITTLDKKDVALDESVLLITDGEHPLAIAGVKGGNFAELDAKTKNIILESANFDPILVRKTAQKIKIQTDASKRYENEITPEFAGEAMEILTKLIVEIAGTKETKVGDTVDIYPKMPTPRAIGISAKDVENILGVAISEKDIADIFSRCGFEFIQNGSDFSVIAPAERLDLTIKEDLAEEIGRLVGYEKIPDIALPKMPFAPETNTVFAYKEKIRNILYGEGFSEVMNYTFVGKGDIELANPASPERKFLRTNLSDGLAESLSFNARNAELVGMPEIRIFEFGHVFPKTGEREHIA
ncbi:phenylalanine--tRNA ligase subunit beta, partial [Patescibacteria group bacterium]|nr:phenylalanine--tRNA ligase subunit beta [Patescibacteria group bacterium]